MVCITIYKKTSAPVGADVAVLKNKIVNFNKYYLVFVGGIEEDAGAIIFFFSAFFFFFSVFLGFLSPIITTSNPY